MSAAPRNPGESSYSGGVPYPGGSSYQGGRGTDTPPAAWRLLGPGVAALVGLYLLTATVGETGEALSVALALTGPMSLLVGGGYVVAGLIGAPIGLLGARIPNATAIAASVLLLIGTALDAFASNYGLLMAGRAVSGLAAGAAVAAAAVVARRTNSRPALIIGLVLALLALLAGPIAGTAVATLLAWRWTFLIALAAAILALIVAVIVAIVVLATGAARR